MGISSNRQLWLSWIIRRLLEFAPIIALAVLAALTYWLLQQKVISDPKAPTPIEHKPDYTLLDFTVRTFDEQGRGRTQLAGARLDFYPDDETSTVDKPVVRSRGIQTHALSQTVANRGVSNRDGSELQFFGAVVATREGYTVPATATQPAAQVPPLKVTSEFLHVWTNEERMRSHVPTIVTRGKSRMSADQMEVNNYDGSVKLIGKARVTLAGAAQAPLEGKPH
jgi:lipopolysaccharide export system protein LptC